MVRVIDVSVHQGRIDWQAVKASGVQGAWIKVGGADGTGGSLYRDSRAAENLAGAEAVGLPYGTYYFCVPDADPRRQAQHAVLCGHGRGQLWPAADIEVNPHGLGRGEIDDWASTFCAEVARQIVRESVIYCGLNTVGFSQHAPSHCALWIANYGADRAGTTPPSFRPALPPAWSDWDAWQYNSVTPVPGIPGNTTDQNVVTDAFWARMTNPSAERIERLMFKAITGDHPNTAGFESMLWPDGMGAFIRIGLPNSVPEKAGLIDGHIALEGDDLDWFANLPTGNPYPANISALTLTAAIIAKVEELRAESGPDAVIDQAALAEKVTAALTAAFAGTVIPAIAAATVDRLAVELAD